MQTSHCHDRLRLIYSKGSRYYEDELVADSSIEDIDMDFVAYYCQKIGYAKSPEEYIRQNKSFIVTKSGRQEMSGAAILLFGKTRSNTSSGQGSASSAMTARKPKSALK